MNRLRFRMLIVMAVFLGIAAGGYVLPSKKVIPVLNATRADWNHHTFWAPWGPSRVHKGIDIFAAEGTPVISSCPGIVVYTGYLGRGGNAVLIIGPRWRFHYYAHLQTIIVKSGDVVSAGRPIGMVGTSGNAKGKPPHLHYSIISMIPRMDLFEPGRDSLSRIFYLNPHDELRRL